MGTGDWFCTITGMKKSKEETCNLEKVNSNGTKSKGSRWNYCMRKKLLGLSNGSSHRKLEAPTKTAEDTAALRIQTAFRNFQARRALCRQKGAERFQFLPQSEPAKQQVLTTLDYLHQWSWIQSEIRARRINMVTEARIRQKKLENQMKLEDKLHTLEVEWCGGIGTLEDLIAKLQLREEAAVKRERAMAYAFSHQWRANSSPFLGPASYCLEKESWDWSWLDHWIAARPWDIRVYPSPKKAKTKEVSKPNTTQDAQG